jgi:hypothetical protein
MDWSILLFVMKWIFLGLVYLMLLLLIIAVQREMRMRLPAAQTGASVEFGRLRVVQSGSDARLRPGLVLSLQPETNLGSQSDNDLVILDRYVSGHHARLHWDGVSWWVDDLNSTNGTFINQQRISPGGSEALTAGSVVGIGDATFELLE